MRATDERRTQEHEDVTYRRGLWLVGLQEEVEVVKTPGVAYAVRQDGSRVSYARLLHEDAQAYRDRFGAGSPSLELLLAHAPADDVLSIAVQVAVPEIDTILAETKSDQVAHAEAAVEERLTLAASWLAEHGFSETSRSASMPLLIGEMPAGALGDILFDGRLAAVWIDDLILPEGSGEYAVDPVADHGIDTTWNPTPGDYANEVPVGMIEWCGFDGPSISRALYDEHVAFTYADVTYSATASACEVDDDCVGEEEGGCETVRCINDRCVTEHGSRVASVISATKPGNPPAESGAAKVRLFLANNAKPNTAAGYDSLYDRLRNFGVKTVNETHAGIHDFGPQVADWYARVFGMLPVQSAGRDNVYGGQACPQSANAVCVGASTDSSTLQVAGHSPTVNPASYPDREEPDIMAFGGDTFVGDLVQTLDFGGTNDWSGSREGTSYSAPAVTSMVAHFRKACEPYFGSNMAHQFLRALLRTSAWAGNPDAGQRYSTPSPSADWLDGAGWVDAPALDWWCQSGTNGTGGTIGINLTGGSDPNRGTTTIYDPGDPAPQAQPMDYTDPSDTGAYPRKEYELAAMFLQVGDRIRFTISWDVCATGPQVARAQASGSISISSSTTRPGRGTSMGRSRSRTTTRAST